jgi:hypothetical protein
MATVENTIEDTRESMRATADALANFHVAHPVLTEEDQETVVALREAADSARAAHIASQQADTAAPAEGTFEHMRAAADALSLFHVQHPTIAPEELAEVTALREAADAARNAYARAQREARDAEELLV